MPSLRTLILAAAVLLAPVIALAQAGAPATAVRPPLFTLVVLVDRDVIVEAFASYRGPGASAANPADHRPFLDHFAAGLREQSRASGIDAVVEVISLKETHAARAAYPAQGRPVLLVRATGFTKANQGWSGDTALEFNLARRGKDDYQTEWEGAIAHENLSPALCGNYERCGKSLAERIFALMRKEGLVR